MYANPNWSSSPCLKAVEDKSFFLFFNQQFYNKSSFSTALLKIKAKKSAKLSLVFEPVYLDHPQIFANCLYYSQQNIKEKCSGFQSWFRNHQNRGVIKRRFPRSLPQKHVEDSFFFYQNFQTSCIFLAHQNQFRHYALYPA